MKNKLRPFHLAYTVNSLEQTRAFYGDLLECKEGRSTDTWVDYDFFGHQLSFHLGSKTGDAKTQSQVDGKSVPMPHFGAVLEWSQFEKLSTKLKRNKTDFVLEPQIRYEGQPGEQKTMFLRDPSGNPLEFKAFKNEDEVFVY